MGVSGFIYKDGVEVASDKPKPQNHSQLETVELLLEGSTQTGMPSTVAQR